MLKKAKHHCKLDRDIKALAWVIRQKLIFYYERNRREILTPIETSGFGN